MKRSKALIFALFISSALGVCSLGISVAWYATSNLLTIDAIEVSVGTNRDLKVSTSSELSSFETHTIEKNENDGSYQDHSLHLNDLTDVVFTPVSSIFSFHEDWYTENTWIDNKEDKPTFYSSYIYMRKKIPNKPLKATTGYYTTDIYLLSNYNCYVTIDPYTSFFNGYRYDDTSSPSYKSVYDEVHEYNVKKAKEIIKNHPDRCNGDYEKLANKMDNLYKAMRVSLLDTDEDSYNYYIIDPFKEETTFFGGRLDSINKRNLISSSISSKQCYDYYVDDDGKCREILYGDIDEDTRDNIVYETEKGSKATIEDDDLNGFVSNTDDNTYALNFEKSLENGVKIATEHSYALKDQGSRDSTIMIPVYANIPKKLTLSIYLEGWDRDCIDNTMGAKFISSLSFMIAKEM